MYTYFTHFVIHIKYVWLNQVNSLQSDGDHEECQEEWHRRRWLVLTDSLKDFLKNCLFYLIWLCALEVPSDSFRPFFAASDLSEQIKAATKDNHVRAENTQLMLSYQKGQITLPQYKVNATHRRPPVNTSMGLHVHRPEQCMITFMFPSGPVVLPLWDLQGAGRGAGQEFLPSSCCTDILPPGTRPPGVPGERPGAFLRLRLEEEGDRPRSHAQIWTETTQGEQRRGHDIKRHILGLALCELQPVFKKNQKHFRLAKRARSCWWPTPTPVIWAICPEVRCWGRLPRNLWGWVAKRGFRFSPSPAWAAPTASSSCTGAGWTASSWRRSRGRRRCRRLWTPSSWTSRWERRGRRADLKGHAVVLGKKIYWCFP